MEMPPAAQGQCASTVVERKLDDLCACLDDALSSRQRSPSAEARLASEIRAKTDFLRSLLAAETECHGGAPLEHLAEAEERFAVLEATFDQWVRRAVAAPELEEALAETGRRTVVQRRWWRRGAAWCAAAVVSLVAVGVAVELAAVVHHNVNVYVVPT